MAGIYLKAVVSKCMLLLVSNDDTFVAHVMWGNSEKPLLSVRITQPQNNTMGWHGCHTVIYAVYLPVAAG